MLNNFAFFNINDSASFFIYLFSLSSNLANFIEVYVLPSQGRGFIDPITMFFINNFSHFFSPMVFNNIYILLALSVNTFAAYIYFNKQVNKELAAVFSFLYSLSLAVLFRFFSATPAMYFIFSFPLLLVFYSLKKPVIYMALLAFLSFMISNYYGFYIYIVLGVLLLLPAIEKFDVKVLLKKLLIFFLVISPVLIIFSSEFYQNSILNTNYGEENDNNITKVYRPIQDWYNLSFRPWYFVIPPQSSLFFGDISKSLYKQITSTGYYLADDYMEEEMAGSYMGWHFVLGTFFVVTLLLLQKYKNKTYPIFKTVYENKEMILRSFFIIFCILLISGPPSFTIGGFTIYTPTYILYYIVPVFRTLVRWAVVIYLFVLIINAYLVQDLYNLMKTKFHKVLFIISFLLLNFIIFAVKIPVINLNKPPVEMAFLRDVSKEQYNYAVYPQGDYYSIFWILVHEKFLLNPVDFVNKETGFISNEFSKALITQEGITEFRKQNPKYFVYYEREVKPAPEKMEKLTKINPQIKTREDVLQFFELQFGKPVFVYQGVYIFKVV